MQFRTLSYEFIRTGKTTNFDFFSSINGFSLSLQQSLNEMKWKCFRRALNWRPESNHLGRMDHYKDPVLVAYWNALRNETLCAWRRVLADDGQKTEKELWLFGTNDDLPNELPNLRRKRSSFNSIWKKNVFCFSFSDASIEWLMERNGIVLRMSIDVIQSFAQSDRKVRSFVRSMDETR